MSIFHNKQTNKQMNQEIQEQYIRLERHIDNMARRMADTSGLDEEFCYKILADKLEQLWNELGLEERNEILKINNKI